MKRLAFFVGLLGFPGLAAADGRGDAVFDSITMDRQSPVSTFGIDLGYVVIDSPDVPLFEDPYIHPLGVTIAGHYVDPRSGFGGYLSVPLSYIGYNLPLVGEDSELALGNVELGGIWSKWLQRDTAIVVHAGLALPTADDDGPGAFQALASSPRYGDFVQRVPNTTWFRLGVSPMGRRGQLFWRADVGLDLAVDDDDNAGEFSPVFRINVGGGIDLHSAQLLAELVTDITDSDGDNSASTLAFGARFNAGQLSPGVALILPLGFDDPNGDLDLAIAVSLSGRL